MVEPVGNYNRSQTLKYLERVNMYKVHDLRCEEGFSKPVSVYVSVCVCAGDDFLTPPSNFPIPTGCVTVQLKLTPSTQR